MQVTPAFFAHVVNLLSPLADGQLCLILEVKFYGGEQIEIYMQSFGSVCQTRIAGTVHIGNWTRLVTRYL